MPGRDLDDLLARVDLEQLADQLIGPRRGNGHGARWPSPVPGHPQTGASPPMSIFVDHHGRQRFTCWATGTSGTAIDLVAVTQRITAGDAIEWLATRHGHEPLASLPSRTPQTPARRDASPALRRYVNDCAQRLWQPEGAAAVRWLVEQRRLAPEVLRDNQVGYDPGPRRMSRAKGLPHLGEGVVIPSFDSAGELTYAQTRYLDPAVAAERKYDNPTRQHGTKPRLSYPRRPCPACNASAIIVCEGVIDALTVIGAGHDAVALVAAGDAESVVKQLDQLDRPLLIAIDCDNAGNNAADTLLQHLSARHAARVTIPGDINDLAQRHSDRFPAVLAATIRAARTRIRPSDPSPCRST